MVCGILSAGCEREQHRRDDQCGLEYPHAGKPCQTALKFR
jgi:hypothetical protein